jgi:hypothetical protein
MKNKTRKNRSKTKRTKGGECKIGVLFPRFGGKQTTSQENKLESLLNLSESFLGGGGCPCSTATQKPAMELPPGVTQGPLTLGLMKGAGNNCGCGSTPPKTPQYSDLLKGGGCPCPIVPKVPTALGGYRATKRNLKYLKLWKQGKSIGFTMRSSLKAKGLIPRANGKKRVSAKYRTF